MIKQAGLDQLTDAYTDRFRYQSENLYTHAWYVERVSAALQRQGASSVVSLGIGHKVVSRHLLEHAPALTRHVIVEGSLALVQDFLAEAHLPPHVQVVNALFEAFETAERFDAVEMGFVLEHVDDPLIVLKRFTEMLKPGGLLFIAVPNARSLHRRIGSEAGLLDDVYRLSEYDLQLGHQRFFDLPALTALVQQADLHVSAAEGIFLKPLTTAQLETLHLPPEVWRALFAVGVAYPDLCNAIYLECVK